MAGEADKLDRAGDEVGGIRRAVDDQMCYSTDALGGSDSGPAYDNFASAWQAEAKTLEAALHELAGKVRVSKQNYQGADHDSIRGLHSAAAGDGLTTMPTPAPGGAGPGITTGLVPGERPAAVGGPPLGTQPTPGSPPPSLADFD
jgi:hypothetical protein